MKFNPTQYNLYRFNRSSNLNRLKGSAQGKLTLLVILLFLLVIVSLRADDYGNTIPQNHFPGQSTGEIYHIGPQHNSNDQLHWNYIYSSDGAQVGRIVGKPNSPSYIYTD